MRITWRGLELPTRIEREREVSTNNYGRFIIEPFERGFGTTIGNSLRRILLSSLQGAAVTSIKISGVDHEFTTIPGVMEDVTELVLNVKKLIIRMQSEEPKVMTVSAEKAGEVKAESIVADPSIQIINTDLTLATLTKDVKFEMEMIVEKGRGYSPSYERVVDLDRFNQESGRIMIDAIYSPVVRVRYRTEDTRVGQRTNYDRLILEVWTNGTISPEMALVEAAKILRKHVNPFVQYFELGQETVEEEMVCQVAEETGIDEELVSKLNMPIEELELSVRASNCLDSVKIQTVGELVKMTEADLLKIRSFGKTSLREVKRKLADIGGLSLGTTNVP
jgi:DNA-directed RNA polymerase subunit alpha